MLSPLLLNIDPSLLWQQLIYSEKSPLIFSSALFLLMFLCFVLIYGSMRRLSFLRIAFVTLFSYYFYYKSSGAHFVILAIVTVSDWLIAHRMYALQTDGGKAERDISRNRAMQKKLIILSLLVDLGMLSYFKYTDFLYRIFCDLTGHGFTSFGILLPVGISFFTFQSLSYTIDIYRGKLRPLDSLLDYAFYVSFFPQLVAGPIVRAADFVPQIVRPVIVSRTMFSRGVMLIASGLFKKAVISDYIGINFVERVFDNPSLYSGLENLLGMYSYTLQIYCDFSGYSDMAIGIALLLGFHFPDNFRSPYRSASVTEFWRRWHISLSSWLRDYLYISLGGNRKGRVRTYVNLFLTMLIGGLWHGASWNFVAWGGLHGVALAVERGVGNMLGIPRKYRSHGPLRWCKVFVTFNFVAFCWLFFRNSDFSNSLLMISRMATAFHPELFFQVILGYSGVMFLVVLGYVLHFLPHRLFSRFTAYATRLPVVVHALILVVVILIVIQVKSSDIQPFIYFQF